MHNSHQVRTQAGVKSQGLYSSLFKQVDGNGAGFGDHNAAHNVRTQAGVRDQGLYSSLYRQVNSNGTGAGLGGEQVQVRTQRGVRDQGLYRSLNPRTTPEGRPYLPYTAQQQAKGLSGFLGGYLGQAAEKTAPGLMVALGLVIAYFVFFKKKKDGADTEEESEAAEEAFVEEEIEPVPSRFYY